MIFSQKETLEDRVIRYLSVEELSVEELQSRLKAESQAYTIQAIYGVLRNLIRVEVLAKRGFTYYLNQEWRSKAAAQLLVKHGLEIADGESLSYHLSSLASSDLQWKNIILPLHESQPDQPIFFYNYHYIWLYLNENRRESELEYFKNLTGNKTYGFCLIGADTIHDREVKRLIQNDFIQVAMGKQTLGERNHITLFGDYIITTTFAPSLVKEIEKCYQSSVNVIALTERLHLLDVQKKKVRLTIERNMDKAKLLRKKFSKNFFIPPEMVKKFDLF